MIQFLSFFTDYLHNLCFVKEDPWKVSILWRLSENHRHSRQVCCLIDFNGLGFGVEMLFINLSKPKTHSLTYKTGNCTNNGNCILHGIKSRLLKYIVSRVTFFKCEFNFFLVLNNKIGRTNIFHGCF